MSHKSDSGRRHHSALDWVGRAVFVATILLVAWGVLAFGAPYPWAYTPLATGAAIVGLAGWFGSRSSLMVDQRRVLLALAAVIAGSILQLVPLPASTVDRISPANNVVLNRIDLAFAAERGSVDSGAQSSLAPRPLSIDPDATLRALLLLACFALLLTGLIHHCNRYGVRGFAVWFLAFGMVVALIGIIQKAVLGDQAWDGMKIYGFWTPASKLTTPFGPFVNKNHFAGWMLMALPIALGYLLAQAEVGLQRASRGWRYRLLWLSSPEGGRLQIAAFAIVLMTVSLLMTLSRSGIACFGMAIAFASIAAARRQHSTRARIGVVLAIGVLVAAPVLWANSNVSARFTARNESFSLRRSIWSDTAHIVRDFPIVGTGLNTFGAAMRAYQTGFPNQNVLEAHDDYLQVIAEGGALVGVPAAAAIVLLILGIRARFRSGLDDPLTSWIRFGATTGLIAIALQSLVEFSLQMPGNAVTFVVLAAIALHKHRGQESAEAVEAARVSARARPGAFVPISK
jgi:O-antigen ligase